MNKKGFTCKGVEWHFLRMFTVVEEGIGFMYEKVRDEDRKNTKKLEIVIILVMILAFSLVIWGILQMIPASQFKSNMNLVFIILAISLIIGAFLMWMWYGYRYVRINKSTVRLPDTEEKLTYYKITKNGIYYNPYNRPNEDQMIFLDWRKVKNMSVEHMRYLPKYINYEQLSEKQHERKLHRLFNNMKKKLATFPYEPKFKYDDVHAVYFLHTNDKYVSELPIPPSWHDNGIYDNFISELKQYVDFGSESVLDRFVDYNKGSKKNSHLIE